MLKKIALTFAVSAVGLSLVIPTFAAAPVKISAVAPVADIAAQADARVKALEEALKSDEEFNKAKGKLIPSEAGVLAALAQAIAESEEKAGWQATAPDVRDAAIALSKAKSYDDAKKEFAAVKDALGGKSSGAKVEYDWAKLVKLGVVMDQISKRNNKFRRNTKKKDASDAEINEMIGDATVAAVLSLATHDDTHEVKSKKAEDIELWKKFAKEYQTQISATSAALKKKDMAGAADAWKKSSQACNDCHAKFKEGE
ncbi:MAG: hypothetical protein JSS02_01265 [Planctomycetes bacterium]|nr:hypothetical protein [Planctomycetota bacterium]